ARRHRCLQVATHHAGLGCAASEKGVIDSKGLAHSLANHLAVRLAEDGLDQHGCNHPSRIGIVEAVARLEQLSLRQRQCDQIVGGDPEAWIESLRNKSESAL